MNAVEVNNFVIEEMGLAEEQDDDAVVRFYLSNDELIEIWFDKDNDCYTWSNASCGYEDTFTIVHDILKWLKDNSLEVIGLETLWW